MSGARTVSSSFSHPTLRLSQDEVSDFIVLFFFFWIEGQAYSVSSRMYTD